MKYNGSYTDSYKICHQFSSCGHGALILVETKRVGGSDYDVVLSSNSYDDMNVLEGHSYPVRLDMEDISLCQSIAKKLLGKLVFEITHPDKNSDTECFLRQTINLYSKEHVLPDEAAEFGLTLEELKGTESS